MLTKFQPKTGSDQESYGYGYGYGYGAAPPPPGLLGKLRRRPKVEGKTLDIGGYYHADPALTSQAMRPSATFNAALATLA